MAVHGDLLMRWEEEQEILERWRKSVECDEEVLKNFVED